MTSDERVRALTDACAHMALAQSCLAEMVDEGASNGRDFILAIGIHRALATQRGRIAKRMKLGRHA